MSKDRGSLAPVDDHVASDVANTGSNTLTEDWQPSRNPSARVNRLFPAGVAESQNIVNNVAARDHE